MFDTDYCDWDMNDEELSCSANVQVKYSDGNTVVIAVTERKHTRFHVYVESTVSPVSAVWEDGYVPLVGVLKF